MSDVTLSYVPNWGVIRLSLFKAALRTVLVLMVVVTVLLLQPATAFAHGSGGFSDATDFSSRVLSVQSLDGEGKPQGPANLPGVKWRVLANDALLQVINESDQELTVPGYNGEPYLRVGPKGVWLNRNSPAYYLNQDRFGASEVPGDAGIDKPPEWEKTGDESAYAWHDHRIHWMSQVPPPQIKGRQAATLIFDWTVPFAMQGGDFLVNGTLRWVPGPPVWPWLVGAMAATTLPLLVALIRPTGRERKQILLKAGAGVLGVVVLVSAIHTVDDIFAVPASLGENIVAFLQSALILAAGGWAAYIAWRGGGKGGLVLLIGAAVMTVGMGVSHLFTLVSSQVATNLPVSFSRAVVAANIAMLVPAALVAWWVHERVPRTPQAARVPTTS